MAIPLIPVMAALAAGGTLVPHAAGGMIVTSATGYVVGTYLSTAAISTIFYSVGATAMAAFGLGTAAVAGAGSAIIGSAGLFGTTVGATGLTGILISAGLISATPIAVPVGLGLAGLTGIGAIGYTAVQMRKVKHRLAEVPAGVELKFSERDAKLIEKLIKWLGNKQVMNQPEDDSNTTSLLTAHKVSQILKEAALGTRTMKRVSSQSWSKIDHGQMPIAIDGWHLTLFKDCNALEYCGDCRAPDGRVGTLELWQRDGADPVNLLNAWEREQLEHLLNAL
ncbi:DUF7693 family protein [Pseudomonas silesiensis]|uniref:DUF7693 family protein n=2 Tax=Pseudomonas TaxID=286 RepID=UPI0034D6730E